jgi:hypothetical protein
LLGAELGRATKPVFDGGDADPGRNDHQSRKKREGEAQGGKGLPVGAGAHRWEQEATGAYPDTRVREATGGGRAQENGAARFGGFFGAGWFIILEEYSNSGALRSISFQTKHA